MAETYAQAATRIQVEGQNKGLKGSELHKWKMNKLQQEGWIDAKGNRTKKGDDSPGPAPTPAARPVSTPQAQKPATRREPAPGDPDFVGPVETEEMRRKRQLREALKRGKGGG